MSRRVKAKWRPPLALVLGGTLATVFAFPLVAIGYLRLAGGVLGYAETSWLIAWIALITVGLLGFLLWRLVLRPVDRLTAFARSVTGRQDAAPPPEHFGTPEFSELGQAVLDMTATLQGREAVLRSYADHVTHELKSPITAVQGAAELLADPDLSDDDRARLVGTVAQAAGRMQELLEAQRSLARASEPMPRGSARLSEVVQGWPEIVVARDGIVPLSNQTLEVVLTQLMGNARAHGATEVRVALEGEVLQIADNGPGISEGNRSRIFDPFFTTRRDAGGTGMGLAIVARLLEAQGAQISLAEGPGAQFEIRF